MTQGSAIPETTSALQQALASVRQLKAVLQRHEEPIAIIGAACRLPGADSLETFWSLLTQQRDAIEEVPASRWSNARYYDPDPMAVGKLATRWAGVIDERAFDAAFFGISDTEATHMDAQQRIFLEVAWEALVNAGQTRESLRGSQTGVYVGAVNYNDGYARRLFDDIERVNAFSGPGVSNSVLAGRLAYLFDLKGPCLAIDTACSSSLVAVHQACQSLRNDECEQAVAGGVNLVLSPEFTVATSRMGLMAADGRCKPFDERADGIVRSDGCGVIVLKRLSDATRDGDRVLALIQASAVNQDGRTNGMTAPNGLAQEALLRGVLTRAGISADSLGYVEAHGTGTKLGDPIEVAALAKVLGTRRESPPCLIGSVKGNIGHCEAAAGIASLIKTVLCLQHRSVPGLADLRSLNQHIDAHTTLAFPRTNLAWPDAGGEPLYGLVSSFGWSGTNAQVILARAAQGEAKMPDPLFRLAAQTRDGLRDEVTRACAALAALPGDQRVEPNSPGATGPFRKAFVTSTAGALANDMRTWLAQDGQAHGPGEKLAFVFSGQGSQWPGMVDQLLAQDTSFRRSLQQSEAIVQRLAGWSLLGAIAARSDTDLALTQWAQPCVVAIQLALFDMLISWGVKPAAVSGHSIGELSAACCAGILGREQALQAALARGRCMAVLHGQGSMHALLAPSETVERIVQQCPGVSISAYNSPGASIVSVAASSLARFQACCATAGVEPVMVNEHYPFHCSQLEPLAQDLQEAFAHLRHDQGAVPFVSTSHGSDEAPLPRDAGYWVRNALRPVRFDLAVARLADLGCDTFIELGPHASLVQHIQRCQGTSRPGLRVMAVLNRHKPLQQSLNALLAGLYEAGQTLGVALDPTPRLHTWQHATYELPPLVSETPPLLLGLAGTRVSDGVRAKLFEASWPGTGLLADHRMFDRVVVPGAMHLSALVTQALRGLHMPAVCIRDVRFLRPLLMAPGERREVAIEWACTSQQGEYQVGVAVANEGTPQALSSAVVLAMPSSPLVADEPPPAAGADARQLDCVAFYTQAYARGLQLGPLFQRIESMWLDSRAQLMQVRLLASSDMAQDQGLVLDPGVLDGCFQALFAGYWQQCPEMDLYIPLAVEELTLAHAVRGELRATICLTTAAFDQHSQILQGDIELHDDQGQRVGTLRNVQLKRAQREALLNSESGAVTQVCGFTWREMPPALLTPVSPYPVVLGNDPLAGLLAARLEQSAHPAARMAGAPGQWVDTGGQGREDTADWSMAISVRLEQLRRLCGQIEDVGVSEARLCVVTRGAHEPSAGDNYLLGAATLAVLRVIANEYPAIRCQAIDLPAAWPPSPTDLDALLGVLGGAPGAGLLRVENGRVFEQALEPLSYAPDQAMTIRADSRYLITGGFGDTGQALCRGLIARGARQITLMGRSRPSPALVEEARGLSQQGHDVHLFQGDVASTADVAALMRQVARRGQPLAGVLHLAGVVEDALLTRLDAQAVSRVLAPKVTGTVNLHHALQGQPLQWFVTFTSLSACIGLAGQSAYAAANGFAQAFMAQRTAMGLAGQAIAWGPWAGGMTARLAADHQQRLQALGLGQMPLEEVVRWTLGCAGLDAHPSVMVAQASPGVLRQRVGLRGPHGAVVQAGPLGDAVALQGSPEQQHAAMTSLVIEELGKATRNVALASDTTLAGLGLDSLGAVAIVQRIRERTGKSLPITAFFDSRTLQDVVAKLLPQA